MPGRYWAAAPSRLESIPRSFARSRVSTSTWRKLSVVQSCPVTGGTAMSTFCGAKAFGGSNWNVTAVVSERLGTTSTHSSMSRPAKGVAGSAAPLGRARGQRAFELGRAGGVAGEFRQHHQLAAEHGLTIGEQLQAAIPLG